MPCKAPHTPVRGISSPSIRWRTSARRRSASGPRTPRPTRRQAQQLITDLTLGVGADQALITVGVVTEEVIAAAFAAIRKAGTVVVTGLAGPGEKNIQVPSFELTLFGKRIQGALFGGGNPFEEIPRMLDMYRAGKLKLDELVTTRYRLDEVQQGYQDLVDGKNVRGVIMHEH